MDKLVKLSNINTNTKSQAQSKAKFNSSDYTIKFSNKSGLPVIVDTWKWLMDGLAQTESIIVKSDEEIELSSITGEWTVHNLLPSNLFHLWSQQGYFPVASIGKFRNKPCARGDYSWMDIDGFDLTYSNGLVTFLKLI